jgi:zinc transport system ATP-binding protein
LAKSIQTDINPAIEVKGVSFSYNGSPVLEQVNLTVQAKDFVIIVGPNGGGKTTLLKLILGQIIPSKGEILVFGEPPKKIRHRVGYVQQTFNFDVKFPVTVFDVVLMGLLERNSHFGFYRKSEKKVALQAIKEVKLEEFCSRPFSSLSGGQQQRVLIARALVSAPKMLLLDEPMAHVDAVVENELFSILGELNKRLPILLVSHDAGYVSTMANRIICVNRNVVEHPINGISGIIELYGKRVRTVKHEHNQEFKR